jgi:hypothetical protein
LTIANFPKSGIFPAVKAFRFFMLLLALAGFSAHAEDSALLEKVSQSLDQQSQKTSTPNLGFRRSLESIDIEARVAPPTHPSQPAQAVLQARQEIQPELNTRFTSGLSATVPDSPEENPAVKQPLPGLTKRDELALEWRPLPSVKSEVWSGVIQNSSEDLLFDQAAIEHGGRLTSKPHPLTSLSLATTLREPLDDAEPATSSSKVEAAWKQKLGQLPLTLEATPSYIESKTPGDPSHRLTSRQALVWNASGDSLLSVGTQWSETEKSFQQQNETQLSYFGEWNRKVSPDISLSVRSEFEQSRQQTPASFHETQRTTLRAGPSFRLNEDLNARIDFKAAADLQKTGQARPPEQAVSLSLQGRF